MDALVFEQSGELVEPNLHDALLYRIDFGGKQVTLHCRTPDEREILIELREVAHLFSTGLAEQNILLDVCVEDDPNVCSRALSRILPGDSEGQQRYRQTLLDRIRANSLKLLRFSPSYGGEVLVICGAALYEAKQST